MLFVNAKINIGLQIVRKRSDGYHDLQTVFYPVGIYAGTPLNPVPFCDILELAPKPKEDRRKGRVNEPIPDIILKGRKVDCDLEKNLVYKAASLFCETTGADFSGFDLLLEKHLPDGAGLGGGSADAAFTLRLLREAFNEPGGGRFIRNEELESLALRLGADCPFFISNIPAYAEGVGECLYPIEIDLSGYWLAIVKPDVYISTREAFSGVMPSPSSFDLRRLPAIPIEKWREYVKNDFEKSIFPRFPEIASVKNRFYETGALYSSMSGSGSSVYAIFRSEEEASNSLAEFKHDATIEGTYLLKL